MYPAPCHPLQPRIAELWFVHEPSIFEIGTNWLAAQEWTNHTLAVHERLNSQFLVLSGSLSNFTEITGGKCLSPSKSYCEFKYKSELNTVRVDLIIEPIWFL